MSASFGIDFGTTNSVLASVTPSGVEVITLDDQLPGEWVNTGFDKVLPSVIGFDASSNAIFGWEAKKQSSSKLDAVKRLFATDDTVDVGGRSIKVEEVAAMFFRHIQSRAKAAGLLDLVDKAVVTIPANSRGKSRFRTKISAGLAGIEVVALINEPTAAAMAHARSIGENQRILVFDWGGGTLDVTVLQATDGTFIEQASKGVQRLGGLDIDAAFMAFTMSRVSGADRWADHERNSFRLDLELAKIQLSNADSTHVALPDGDFLEVTRGQFEESIGSLIERTREPVEVCLRESPGRIDHLVMVGGSSKMPIIQRFVSNIVGTEPSQSVDPMTAIAEGAAIAAGVLAGVVNDVDFFVGTEHALGTIINNPDSPTEGEFSVLIRRNTKLPARAEDVYTPANDMQEKLNVNVIEGDPSLPIFHEDNVVLKNWNIDLLEPRPRQDASFSIIYEYDVDGILHVVLRDLKTGTIMMDEELAFGAGQDKRSLPQMRQRIDDLMSGGSRSGGESVESTSVASSSSLSRESQASIDKAQTKIVPFVSDADVTRLGSLIEALENGGSADEQQNRDALDREIRNHAYLL
jgi:molecular chaperone DnaK (HSP70)